MFIKVTAVNVLNKVYDLLVRTSSIREVYEAFDNSGYTVLTFNDDNFVTVKETVLEIAAKLDKAGELA